MSEPTDLERNLKTVIVVLDIAVAACFLWLILPPSVKLEVKLAVAPAFDKVAAVKRRRKAERQRDYELYLLRGEVSLAEEALARYDRDRDPDQLARDLAA